MITAVHPEYDRYLNVREMMHLMGLPMEFMIDNVKNVNHMAQNVLVCTDADYAVEVVKFCRGKANMSGFSFMKQDERADQRQPDRPAAIQAGHTLHQGQGQQTRQGA